MLTRIRPDENQAACCHPAFEGTASQSRRSAGAMVRICEARFPQIFPWRLEYNCPVHENWNIVHTGMLIPQTHQIYVCSLNCLRGVVMTADEMGCPDRISAVMPTQGEVVGGRLEEITIEGTSDLIGRFPERPRAIELFLVCMHHLCGVDEQYIFRELRRRFPDIDFMSCWMDPIMQKVSLTPEQKQRRSMMAVIPKLPENPRTVSIFGDNLRLPESSDISRLLESLGIRIRQVMDCRDYDAYLRMGDSFLYMTRSALSVCGLRALSEKNDRPFLYLPPVALDEQIREGLLKLLETIEQAEGKAGRCFLADSREGELHLRLQAEAGLTVRENQAFFREKMLVKFLKERRTRAKEAFARAKAVIGDTEVWMDYLAFPRPLSMARRLLQEGFVVTRVCLDSVSQEEKADFDWLQQHQPGLMLQSTSHVEARERKRISSSAQVGQGKGHPILALGPKAAFFAGTPYFVNWIENNGNWGYDGLEKLASEMIDSYRNPKDLRDIVQRKGLGLPSLPEREEDR